MTTLAERAAEPTSGFDYLRIGLALAIVAWHSVAVTRVPPVFGIGNGPEVAAAWAHARPVLAIILPMFFTLSGFLVAQSLERTRLEGFVTLRILRIGPALAVEVLLSAFVLGPLLTTRPLAAYFSNPTFFQYLLNVVGDVHFKLPGVYEQNPVTGWVNAALWTVPYELLCYVLLVTLALLGLHKRRRLFLAVAVAASVLVPILDYQNTLFATNNLSGRMLVVSFIAGVTLCLYRDRVQHSFPRFLACLFLSLVLLSQRPLDVLAIWPVAYVTVYLGLLKPKKVPVLFSGDYSYGIYLFAFPIQQALWLTPFGKHWAGNFPAAVACSFLYAAFSWRFVEKPILARKKSIVTHVQQFFDRLNGRAKTKPVVVATE